jgi:hypothetical protein
MASFYYDGASGKLLPADGGARGQDSRTRFLVLREGEIAFHGTLQELIAQPDPYLQKFLA